MPYLIFLSLDSYSTEISNVNLIVATNSSTNSQLLPGSTNAISLTVTNTTTIKATETNQSVAVTNTNLIIIEPKTNAIAVPEITNTVFVNTQITNPAVSVLTNPIAITNSRDSFYYPENNPPGIQIRVVTTNFFAWEADRTEKIILTNYSIYDPPSILNTPVSNMVLITNILTTNIIKLDVYNRLMTNTITNYQVTNVLRVYRFHESFPKLANLDFGPEDEDDLEAALMNDRDLTFIGKEPEYRKKIRWKQGLDLMSDEELIGGSEKVFLKNLNEKKTGQLLLSEEEKTHITIPFTVWGSKMEIAGSVQIAFGYGWSRKDEAFTQSVPGIISGFKLEQIMRVMILGKFGDRITTEFTLDSQSENTIYEVAYRALTNDIGFLRELKIGNIALSLPTSSYYISYSGTGQDNMGLKAVFEKDDWNLQVIANITKGQKGYKSFVGNKKNQTIDIPEINYEKRKYFMLPDTKIDAGSVRLYALTAQTNLADRQIAGKYFVGMIEGKDYFLNYSTGDLVLSNSLNRNTELLIRYTHLGQSFTTNTNSDIGTDNQNGDKYLFLWKSTYNYSPYLHNGYYYLGYKNFDPTRGFEMTVVNTANKSQTASFQFTASDYEISPINGLIKFHKPAPFPDVSGKVYTNASDSLSSYYSTYTMHISLYNEVKSYQLEFGVVAGTEKVLVNGRTLTKDEYLILYELGELIFRNSALINENDLIEVYYEYKPFFIAPQKIGVAARLDWKPSKLMNFGSTMILNASQATPGGAPNIVSTPDGMFMADIDGNLNLAKMLGLNDQFVFNLKGEAALTYRDANILNYALIDDFESSGDSFAVMVYESLWNLCAPTTNIAGMNFTNRGKLQYKDYRNYALDGSFTLLNYTTPLTADQMRDYSDKPGPYLVLGGHLDPLQYSKVNQSSLAFDYDFTSGDWVGSAISLGGPSGMDLSEYNEIVVWAKVESDEDGNGSFVSTGSQTVDFYLAVGSFNEDSDGDGALDAETERNQAGYDFNDPTNKSVVLTHIGRGRLGKGDSIIQTEDINRDGVMQTTEDLLIFPSAKGYTDMTNLTIAEGGWQKYTINLKTLTKAQLGILEHANGIGVYIKKRNGTKGRLLFDSIEFKQINWKDKRIDGIVANSSPAIHGEAISVFNNQMYSENRFYDRETSDVDTSERVNIFEKLHGSHTVAEANQLNEYSLAIHYDLSNVTINTLGTTPTGGMNGRLIKDNTASYDVTRYNYITFYVYVPNTDEKGDPYKTGLDTYNNENFVITLANTERNYYKWSLPLSNVTKNKWHKVNINIFDNLKLYIDGTNTGSLEEVGYPNLKAVNSMELGIDTVGTTEPQNKGVIWVNEMYAYSDVPILGTAFYVSPTFEYRSPILTLWDIEFIGPLSISATYENKSYDFYNSTASSSGDMNERFNISLNNSVFKYLRYYVTYNYQIQKTDTNTIQVPKYLQWDSFQTAFNFGITFNNGQAYYPILNHSFTENFTTKKTRSLISTTSNETIMGFIDSQYNGSIGFDLRENIPIQNYYSINSFVKFDDSMYIMDKSSYSNENYPKYLTNLNIYGMKNLRKSFDIGVNFILGKISFGGTYNKAIEKYEKIVDETGYRNELMNLSVLNGMQRYGMRLQNMFQGFYFEGFELDKQYSDAVLFNPVGAVRPRAGKAFTEIQHCGQFRKRQFRFYIHYA